MHLRGPILGIWAHPDDEAFLSAGLMVEAIRAGQRVVCVTATRGELGIQDVARWPAEQLAEIREAELKETLGILGVTEHHWLDFPDGGCVDVSMDEAVGKLCAIIEDVRPANVLTFGPDGMTAHQDHIAVSAWATMAFQRCAPEGSRLLYATMSEAWLDEYLPLMISNEIFMEEDARPPATPDEQLAISFHLPDDIFELKNRSLRAQASQIEAIIRAFGEPTCWDVNRTEFFRLAAER